MRQHARWFMSVCQLVLVTSTLAPLAAGQNLTDILVEAEDYWKKVSSSPSFARPYREPAASARKVLVGFSEDGYVLYRFEVKAAHDMPLIDQRRQCTLSYVAKGSGYQYLHFLPPQLLSNPRAVLHYWP